MFKKEITYTDFNDDTVTEVHYFHLSKAELIELQMSKKGGLDKWIENIIASSDGKVIMEEFKRLILLCYGEKSDDGRRFTKNAAIREQFASSEAYSTLFVELCTDSEAAAAFVNGVVPKNLEKGFAKMKVREDADHVYPVLPNNEESDKADPGPRVLTRTEVLQMDHDELSHLLATGAAVIGQFGD